MGSSIVESPLVNSWTEWGELETVCVGNAANMSYPEWDPFHTYNMVQDSFLRDYIPGVVGPRPKHRIAKAQNELANLCHILRGECISVTTLKEFDEDTRQHLTRKRSTPTSVLNIQDDARVVKKAAEVIQPPDAKFDQLIVTPWFKNNYQYGVACPRDMIITMGNTILECATAARGRYFEAMNYRNMVYKYWTADTRIHFKKAPPPTCQDAMYNFDLSGLEPVGNRFADSGYKTAVNETEIAFDAADMMRVGKDIFIKKGSTTNNKGVEWLRREFPHFRFHLMHFPNDSNPHLDVGLIPLRPPSAGSDGIVLISQMYPPLESEVQLFTDNGWQIHYAPLADTEILPPVAVCSAGLNINLLSLSPKCCLIEECETKLYDFLTDLGFDVITCTLRTLNEFGGGVHCVTWDIKRNDDYRDFLPVQDYAKECCIDLNNFYDDKLYKPELVTYKKSL